MGIDVTFGKAYAKAAIAAGQRLPQSGNVFITMMDKYKEAGGCSCAAVLCCVVLWFVLGVSHTIHT
jgi:hypothetical protein